MNNERSYPAYFKAANAVFAVINDETALVAFKGGTVQIQNDKAFVDGAFKNGVKTTGKQFNYQYNSNIELIGELKKLLVVEERQLTITDIIMM